MSIKPGEGNKVVRSDCTSAVIRILMLRASVGDIVVQILGMRKQKKKGVDERLEHAWSGLTPEQCKVKPKLKDFFEGFLSFYEGQKEGTEYLILVIKNEEIQNAAQ